MSVGTKFTATYVGMVVECGHVMECIDAVRMALLTLSTSAFIEPSLHVYHLDFFLGIFLWRLVFVLL